MIEILALVVLMFIAGGFLLIISGRNAAPKHEERPAPGTNPGIVTVRNASSRKLLIELDVDELSGMQTVPFYSDLEFEAMNEKTLLERYLDPNISDEERMEIEDELSINYKLAKRTLHELSPVTSGRPAEEKSVNDFSDISDLDVLNSRLRNPYLDDDTREALKKRIAELQGGDDDDADPGMSGPVDPDTHESTDDGSDDDEPEPEVPGQPQDGAPAERQSGNPDIDSFLNEVEKVNELSEMDLYKAVLNDTSKVPEGPACDLVVPFSEDEPVADDSDSLKSIELMTFIAHSFKDGLIKPELVVFAQQKLNLQIADNLWNDGNRQSLRKPREAVMESFKELENMSVEQFDLHVRETVSNEQESRSGAEDAPEVPAQQEEAQGSPVTVLFDRKGGKHDLMWQRLEARRAKA